LRGDRPPPIEAKLNVIEGDATLSATAEVVKVSLDKVAAQEGLSVADQVTLQDAKLRKSMANRISIAFLVTNLATVIALALLARLDQSNIALKLIVPGDRIITSQVFMALLGATTVQLGAVMVIIAHYLFPSRSS
jgi:hypothetical protein